MGDPGRESSPVPHEVTTDGEVNNSFTMSVTLEPRCEAEDGAQENDDQMGDTDVESEIEGTPTPLRGGKGGNPQAGDSVCQHSSGVSAPT